MKKLNNKGFTIAEVLVSFSLITVILASLISSTLYFRDRLKKEEVISQLVDFRNTIVKTINDDIVKGEISSVERCIGEANCLNLVTTAGQRRVLKIEEADTSDTLYKGAYLNYNGTKYFLPDSDLGESGDRVCDFIGGFQLEKSANYPAYRVKTSIQHRDFDLKYDIIIVVS